MADMIKYGELTVTREKEDHGYAPIKIGFQFPITDESMRSIAAFAYGIAEGEREMMRKMWEEGKE